MTVEGVADNILTPIACKYCEYITFIEFDLYEAHNIRGNKMINEGKKLGATLDDDAIQKLNLKFSKHFKQDETSPSVQKSVGDVEGVVPQHVRDLSNLMSIFSLDKFFHDDPDKPYSALRDSHVTLSLGSNL